MVKYDFKSVWNFASTKLGNLQPISLVIYCVNQCAKSSQGQTLQCWAEELLKEIIVKLRSGTEQLELIEDKLNGR